MTLQTHTTSCTGDVKELFSHLFGLCNRNALTRPPQKNIIDYFIRIQLWNGVKLVLDRHPTAIKTMGLDTKVMADFLSTVEQCCILTTMWEVLRNEQDLLEGV
eukprot:11200838-Ditylum_brightwellii.AAC.1